MALFVEIQAPASPIQRQPIRPGANRLRAEPGHQYRVVDDQAASLSSAAAVRRIGNSLVVEGVASETTIEFVGFFRNCTPEAACSLSLGNFANPLSPEITPASLPIGALQDGSFVMHAPSALAAVVPPAPEAETGGRGALYLGLGLLGLGAAAGAGGGGGGNSGGGPTAVGAPPEAPRLTSARTITTATPVIAGTAEPGSLVTVSLDFADNGVPDVTYLVTTAADGRWSVSIGVDAPGTGSLAQGRLPEGSVRVLARAANGAGTGAGLMSELILVDSLPPAPPVIDPVAGDNVVSAAEAAAGVQVSGRSEPAAAVTINWLGLTRVVSADSAGAWNTSYTAAQIAAAGNDRTVQASARDAAGNVSAPSTLPVTLTTTRPAPTIRTIAADDIVNLAEANAGVVVTGSSDAAGNISITLGTTVRTVTAATNGTFTATFSAAELPRSDGAYAVRAVAIDANGNRSAEGSRAIAIDRAEPTVSIAAVTGDNVVSFAERAAGVSIAGGAEAGSSVTITWSGATRTTTATGGSYSVLFDAGSVPTSGVTSVRAVATDTAGNVSPAVTVSTIVDTTATRYSGSNGADTLSLTKTGLENLAAPGANIDGRNGTDTLSFTGTGITLDLLAITATAITSFERLNITGTGNNTVRLGIGDVLDMASSNTFNSGNGWAGLPSSVAQRQLVIDGNAGDVVQASGGWVAQAATVSNGGQTYAVYTSGTGGNAAMLLIDTDITRSIV